MFISITGVTMTELPIGQGWSTAKSSGWVGDEKVHKRDGVVPVEDAVNGVADVV